MAKQRITIPVNKPTEWLDASNQPMSAGVYPITQTLPQVAQLEIKYQGPLIKDSVVEKLVDLTNLDTRAWNYQHRRVWVKEYACEYYLNSGDGSKLEHWKRAIGRMVVNRWMNGESYQEGDIVSLGGKLYFATCDIVAIELYENSDNPTFVTGYVWTNSTGVTQPMPNPETNEEVWQVVTGEIETYRYLFTNTNEILIWTEVRNPIFEVILGDVVTDSQGSIVLNPETGLAELTNKEIVEACIIQANLNGAYKLLSADSYTQDGTYISNGNFEQGGVPYVIRLYSDEECKETSEKFSGCINIK